ncbi:MAG: glycoside hydrolase family 38 C-terminal domain-containing protein [Chloroflexia bacterium]
MGSLGWDEGYALEGEEVASVESIEITESGPLRASVRVVRRWHNSTITQTYSTMTYEPHLRIHTHIDWHERRVMLKARFPIAVHATEATYETICGVVRRPTHTNTSWDQARFEVSGHRFADVSQPNFGVALLNDGKYGHSANGSEVALTLLRSPMFPHPLADEGEHEFTYCLLPHDGSWNAAHVPNEAHQLNSPPSWVLAEHRSEGPLEPEDGLCHPANEINLMLSGLKRAEDGDGMILRMYETGGEGGTAQLHFHKPVKSIRRTNLMEDDVEVAATALDETKRMASFKVRPFELITFRIHLAP